MKYLLIFALSLSSIPGCGSGRTTLVLLDVSGSVTDDDLTGRYTDVTARVAESMRGGDRLLGDRISDEGFGGSELLLDVEMPQETLADNSFAAAAARDTVVAAARRAVGGLFDDRGAPCTDIVGALDAAARVLATAPDAGEKRLVLVTDAVNTCAPLNLLDADLSEDAVRAFVDGERDGGRLPDLAGVRVWVAGAGTDPRVSRERGFEIERFWRAYFEAAGATLAPENYGPTLIGWL